MKFLYNKLNFIAIHIIVILHKNTLAMHKIVLFFISDMIKSI